MQSIFVVAECITSKRRIGSHNNTTKSNNFHIKSVTKKIERIEDRDNLPSQRDDDDDKKKHKISVVFVNFCIAMKVDHKKTNKQKNIIYCTSVDEKIRRCFPHPRTAVF